jgi:hypothetical protein
MRSISKFFTITLFTIIASLQAMAQLHPMESLGREIFDSFRASKFSDFYNRSVFSLNEDSFKSFLFGIRNKSIRDDLINLHKQNFPEDSTFDEKWKIAFMHQWRQQLRHIASYTPTKIRDESFIPVLKEANEYGVQWKTTRLLAIEALLPVSWKNGRFQIKGDLDLDANSSNSRILYLDRNLDYRLTLNKLTYSKTFMIGTEREDSDKSYKRGILGNGSGQGDILLKFDSQTPSQLFYFCPDQQGAGGPIIIKDFDDLNKPNQRTDILLTFAYDEPARAFQLLIKDALLSGKGAIFTERPKFLGEVPLPRGLSFPN